MTTEDNKDQGAAEATTCALITIGVNPDDAEEDTPFFLSALAEAGYSVVKAEWEYGFAGSCAAVPLGRYLPHDGGETEDGRLIHTGVAAKVATHRRRITARGPWVPVPEGGEQ